jgi:transglutaminase-like putative cysteine protease
MNPSSLNRLFSVVLICLVFSSHLFSQEPPIKWGEIPRADLEMKSFPQDSNASAIILCDFGESSFNDDLYIVFKRHSRVKILTAKGYEWGTRTVDVYSKEDMEQISNIEGVTYSLDEKGKQVINTLSEKDIFKEAVDDTHTRYRFTLPALQPGCVVELRYTIKTDRFWLMRNWIFQHSEPTLWSEYRVSFPANIRYILVTNGYEPFCINEMRQANEMFDGVAAHYLGNRFVACEHWRLAAKNLPALRDEPYIMTLDDYYNRLDIQLAAYSLAGTGVKQIMNSWNKFVDDLLEEETFCKRIDDTKHVRNTAAQITALCTTPDEKVNAIYNWVSKSIVWTGQNHIFSNQEADEVLESKKGSSADITFLLLSLLKSSGINGEPVLLSTRANGKIQVLYPILSQFNYELARVVIGNQCYYLDATNPLRPIELLPEKVLNTRGLIIRKDASEWVTLSTQKKYVNNSLALLNLHEDGSVDGTFEDSYKEYAGFINRQNLHDKKDIDVAKETFETEQAGITIDSVLVVSKDSIHVPLKLKAWITCPSYAQQNGDLIYVNPHIVHRNRENPFKLPIRKFPIDYSYQRSSTHVVTFALPNGFEVKERIFNQSFGISDLAAYSQEIQIDSNKVQMVTKLDISATEVPAKFYNRLREFYAQVVAAESEQLVLARIKKHVAPASETRTAKKKGKK